MAGVSLVSPLAFLYLLGAPESLAHLVRQHGNSLYLYLYLQARNTQSCHLYLRARRILSSNILAPHSPLADVTLRSVTKLVTLTTF